MCVLNKIGFQLYLSWKNIQDAALKGMKDGYHINWDGRGPWSRLFPLLSVTKMDFKLPTAATTRRGCLCPSQRHSGVIKASDNKAERNLKEVARSQSYHW